MISEMEMLLSLAVLTLCTVSRDATNPWPEKAGFVLCVYSHILDAIHSLLHVVTHESSTAQKITCCRSASKFKLMCYFLM